MIVNIKKAPFDKKEVRQAIAGGRAVAWSQKTELGAIVRPGNPARQVAVVAIDPSSPFTGGAVLGDRVRMRDLAGDPGIFIRSMASRGSLGGLAQATASMVQVFDAAGFEVIMIETVGAGQTEVDIARLAQPPRDRSHAETISEDEIVAILTGPSKAKPEADARAPRMQPVRGTEDSGKHAAYRDPTHAPTEKARARSPGPWSQIEANSVQSQRLRPRLAGQSGHRCPMSSSPTISRSSLPTAVSTHA